ncbi:MAG: hypothetical protein VKN72_28435 [Nostocales cyanobacterium 94392]|nr:hypothetical protein [Nostocales cyanobacterium 94392]
MIVFIDDSKITGFQIQALIKFRNSRDCHNTRMVRDTKNLIIPLKINQSVTAPYGQNVPVA